MGRPLPSFTRIHHLDRLYTMTGQGKRGWRAGALFEACRGATTLLEGVDVSAHRQGEQRALAAAPSAYRLQELAGQLRAAFAAYRSFDQT